MQRHIPANIKVTSIYLIRGQYDACSNVIRGGLQAIKLHSTGLIPKVHHRRNGPNAKDAVRRNQ